MDLVAGLRVAQAALAQHRERADLAAVDEACTPSAPGMQCSPDTTKARTKAGLGHCMVGVLN